MRGNDKARNDLTMNNERQFASAQLIGKRNEVEMLKGKKETIYTTSNLVFSFNRGPRGSPNSRQFSVFSLPQ